ncbi:MAG: methionine synthase [Candidatus Omnitrophota bacterium]|nr:methionine synthase [Candidatus Omnitrophota bacterium]
MPKFDFEATGIGSLPFKDPKSACRLIFDNFRSIPFWPQLNNRSFKEHMYCQFSEGLPGVVIDEKKRSIYIDSAAAASGMEKAYQKYLDQDVDYFKISGGFAEGLHEFIGSFKKEAPAAKYVKGHITGPVSFALSVTDENKKALIYDKDMFDVTTKVLTMKARWQIRELKKLSGNVIIFIDEPYLVSIGSSHVNIPVDDAMRSLDDIFSAIREEGAISGIHCCGNTDWPLLLKRGVDILNFDAYNFTNEFFLYHRDIKDFIERGSSIAWGIVPSSEAADSQTPEGIAKRLKAALKVLEDKGIDGSKVSSLVTSSCGLGTLEEKRAKRIVEMVNRVSDICASNQVKNPYF